MLRKLSSYCNSHCIVLCCVYIERVKKVNGLVSKTYTISYKMGETVEFGEDIEDYGMNLVVTLYPTKKVVPLS